MADPFLMPGAARFRTDTRVEHCWIVVLAVPVALALLSPLAVDVWVPGPVVVSPERKE